MFFQDENQSQSAVEEGACQTASQKSGSCVPLIRCRQYLGRSNISDITNSSCRDEISPRVCCPSIADDETTVTADISTKDSTTTLLMTTRSPTKTPTNVSRELSTDNGRRRGNGIFPIGNYSVTKGFQSNPERDINHDFVEVTILMRNFQN